MFITETKTIKRPNPDDLKRLEDRISQARVLVANDRIPIERLYEFEAMMVSAMKCETYWDESDGSWVKTAKESPCPG